VTQAEREALRLQREFLERGRSFAVETTRAGTAILCLMEDARHHRFTVQLLYIGIEDVQTAIDRIAVQVTRGGHHIPAIDVRRRYNRSLGHLRAEIERADRVMLIDNTPEQGPRKVLEIDHGHTTVHATDMPRWVTVALGITIGQDDAVEPSDG